MAKELEAEDIELKDYSFTPKEINVNGISVLDYTEVENDKVFLCNKKDILDKPRPSWIPELDSKGLAIDKFLPICVKDFSDGNYFVQSKIYTGEKDSKGKSIYKNQIYKMSPDVLAATVDYYLKRKRAELKTEGSSEKVSLPRGMNSMPTSRYNEISKLCSLCEVPSLKYKDVDKSITDKAFEMKGKSPGKLYQIQNNVVFLEQWQPLLENIKGKRLDMNYQKQDYIDSYSKAVETAYGDSKTFNNLYNDFGVKIKKQNGTNFSKPEIEKLSETLKKVYAHYGNLSELAGEYGLKISYADNCMQFARKSIGLYLSYHNAIGISFFNEEKQLSVAGSNHLPDVTLAHEVAHWLDNQKGKESHNFFASDKYGTLENKIATKFKEEIKLREKSNKSAARIGKTDEIHLGEYWFRTCECFARAMEQYYALKQGIDLSEEIAYARKDNFEEDFIPLIEELMEENKIHFGINDISHGISNSSVPELLKPNLKDLKKFSESYAKIINEENAVLKSKPDTFNYLRGANKSMDNKVYAYHEKMLRIGIKKSALEIQLKIAARLPFSKSELSEYEKTDVCKIDKESISLMDKNTFEYFTTVINSVLLNGGYKPKREFPFVLRKESGEVNFWKLKIDDEDNTQVISASINTMVKEEFYRIEEQNTKVKGEYLLAAEEEFLRREEPYKIVDAYSISTKSIYDNVIKRLDSEGYVCRTQLKLSEYRTPSFSELDEYIKENSKKYQPVIVLFDEYNDYDKTTNEYKTIKAWQIYDKESLENGTYISLGKCKINYLNENLELEYKGPFVAPGYQITARSYYNSKGTRELCHVIKEADRNSEEYKNAIEKAASYIAEHIHKSRHTYLVPAPNHNGKAEYTYDIARIVGQKINAPVFNILECKPHETLYEQKKKNLEPDVELFLNDYGKSVISNFPEGRNYIYLIDNCISTGLTFNKAAELINGLIPAVYAIGNFAEVKYVNEKYKVNNLLELKNEITHEENKLMKNKNEQKYIAKLMSNDSTVPVDFWRWSKNNLKDFQNEVIELLADTLPVSKENLANFDKFVILKTEPDGTEVSTELEVMAGDFLIDISDKYKEKYHHFPYEDKYDCERWKFITDGQRKRIEKNYNRRVFTVIDSVLSAVDRAEFLADLIHYENGDKKEKDKYKIKDTLNKENLKPFRFIYEGNGFLGESIYESFICKKNDDSGFKFVMVPHNADYYKDYDKLVVSENTYSDIEECQNALIDILVNQKENHDYKVEIETNQFYKIPEKYKQPLLSYIEKNEKEIFDKTEEFFKTHPKFEKYEKMKDNIALYLMQEPDAVDWNSSEWLKKFEKIELSISNPLLANTIEVNKEKENKLMEKTTETKEMTQTEKDSKFLLENFGNKKLVDAAVKKASINDFVSKDQTRYFMTGIYYEKGFAIATDGRMLIKQKKTYPEKWEGKIIDPKTGKEIHGQFPNYKRVFPDRERLVDRTSRLAHISDYLSYATAANALTEVKRSENYVPVVFENTMVNSKLLLTALSFAREHGFNKVYQEDNYKQETVPVLDENGKEIYKYYKVTETSEDNLRYKYYTFEELPSEAKEAAEMIDEDSRKKSFVVGEELWSYGPVEEKKIIYENDPEKHLKRPIQFDSPDGSSILIMPMNETEGAYIDQYGILKNYEENTFIKTKLLGKDEVLHKNIVRKLLENTEYNNFDVETSYNKNYEEALKKQNPDIFPKNKKDCMILASQWTYADAIESKFVEKNIILSSENAFKEYFSENTIEVFQHYVKNPSLLLSKNSRFDPNYTIEKAIEENIVEQKEISFSEEFGSKVFSSDIISNKNIKLNNITKDENGINVADLFIPDADYIREASISDERFAMPVVTWKDNDPNINISIVKRLNSEPHNKDIEYMDYSSNGNPSIFENEKWNLVREQKTFDLIGEQIKQYKQEINTEKTETATEVKITPVTLEEILGVMDMRPEFSDSGKIMIYDEQRKEYIDNGQNFEGSGNEVYEFESAAEIFERLDIYINDYYIHDMQEQLEGVGIEIIGDETLSELCKLYKTELGKGNEKLSIGELNLAMGIVAPDTVIYEQRPSVEKNPENTLQPGQNVSLSLKQLYEELSEKNGTYFMNDKSCVALSDGKTIEFYDGQVDSDYAHYDELTHYDLYSKEGELLCCDGETVSFEGKSQSGNLIFKNNDIGFSLSKEEFEIASKTVSLEQRKEEANEIRPEFFLYGDTSDEKIFELKEHLSKNGYDVKWQDKSETNSFARFTCDIDDKTYIQTILEDRGIDYEYKLGLLATGYDAAWLNEDEVLDAEVVTQEEFNRINALREKEFKDLKLPYIKIDFTEGTASDHKSARMEGGTIFGLKEGEELLKELNNRFNTFLKCDVTVNFPDAKDNEPGSYSLHYDFHDDKRTLENGKDVPFEREGLSDYIRMTCSYPEVLEKYEEQWQKVNAQNITEEQKKFVADIIAPNYEKLKNRYNEQLGNLNTILDVSKKLNSSWIVNASEAKASKDSIEKEQNAIALSFERYAGICMNHIANYLDENKDISFKDEFLIYAKHQISNMLQDVKYGESRNVKYGEHGYDFDFSLWRKSLEKVMDASEYDSFLTERLQAEELKYKEIRNADKDMKLSKERTETQSFDFAALADNICQNGFESSASGFDYSFDFSEIAEMAGKDESWVKENLYEICEALTGHNDELLLDFNENEALSEDGTIHLNFCSVGEDYNELFKKDDDGRWIRKTDNELRQEHLIDDEIDKGIESIQANGGMSEAALEAEYEAQLREQEMELDDEPEEALPVWPINGEVFFESEIEESLKADVEELFRQYDSGETEKNLTLVGVKMYRDPTKDGKISLLVEFDSKNPENRWREDSLFNALNEEGIEFNGMKVDFNPITKEKSGTIEQYLKQLEGFGNEEEVIKENAQKLEEKEIENKLNDISNRLSEIDSDEQRILPFSIFENKEKGRINIKFDTAKINRDILKELKAHGWKYAASTKQWYPVGNAVKTASDFANRLQEKYSETRNPNMEKSMELGPEKSPYDGIRFFDRNYNESEDFAKFFNSNIHLFKKGKESAITEEDAATILNAIGFEKDGIVEQRKLRVGLDNKDKIVILTSENGNVKTEKIELSDILEFAKNKAEERVIESKQMLQNYLGKEPVVKKDLQDIFISFYETCVTQSEEIDSKMKLLYDSLIGKKHEQVKEAVLYQRNSYRGWEISTDKDFKKSVYCRPFEQTDRSGYILMAGKEGNDGFWQEKFVREMLKSNNWSERDALIETLTTLASDKETYTALGIKEPQSLNGFFSSLDKIIHVENDTDIKNELMESLLGPSEAHKVSKESTKELSVGDKLGEDIVSNLYWISDGVCQATLSREVNGVGSAQNYFVIDNSIINQLDEELKELVVSFDSKSVIENKSYEPYILKELIEKGLMPPRDDDFIQQLDEYISVHPLKYEKLKPVDYLNFERKLQEIAEINKAFNKTPFELGQQLIALVDESDREKLNIWLRKQGCDSREHMAEVFDLWLKNKEQKKDITQKKNNGYPPRGE